MVVPNEIDKHIMLNADGQILDVALKHEKIAFSPNIVLGLKLKRTPHPHMLSPSNKCVTYQIVRSAEYV